MADGGVGTQLAGPASSAIADERESGILLRRAAGQLVPWIRPGAAAYAASRYPQAPAQAYFVELLLRQSGTVVDRNVYWLSTQQDVRIGRRPSDSRRARCRSM